MSYFDEEKKYIPPDYDSPPEDEPDDDDDDLDESGDDEIDEGKLETELDKNSGGKTMVTGGGFGTPTQQPTSSPWSAPNFGNSGSQSGPFGSAPSSPWSNGSSPWKGTSGGSIWSGGQAKTEQTQINREKEIIFCDFLDCIVETLESQGRPGFLPRDIYDLKPRFDVWSKIQAFNPRQVYAMIPINLIPNTNGAQGWIRTLEYFCSSLSAYLQIPESNCKILAQTTIGQPKEELMNSILNGPGRIRRGDSIYIGVYSGLAGQSNRDLLAAQNCQIDYVDLGVLLNNMY